MTLCRDTISGRQSSRRPGDRAMRPGRCAGRRGRAGRRAAATATATATATANATGASAAFASACAPGAGFVLLEALVAILIFSIGVIALIGLQGAMSQNLTAARMRGDASVLASQLIGQMWVDQGNLASYAVSDTACTSASYLACQEWLAGVRQKLPKAGAAVRVDHGRVDIRLAWTVPGQEPAFYDLQSTVSK